MEKFKLYQLKIQCKKTNVVNNYMTHIPIWRRIIDIQYTAQMLQIDKKIQELKQEITRDIQLNSGDNQLKQEITIDMNARDTQLREENKQLKQEITIDMNAKDTQLREENKQLKQEITIDMNAKDTQLREENKQLKQEIAIDMNAKDTQLKQEINLINSTLHGVNELDENTVHNNLALDCQPGYVKKGREIKWFDGSKIDTTVCESLAHTGNSGILGYFGKGFSCDMIGDNLPPCGTQLSVGPGLKLDLDMVCPEKCGASVGFAPVTDTDAIARSFDLDNCASIKKNGLCETDMIANWFCGETCRGGSGWDECLFSTTYPVQEQISSYCNDYWSLDGYENVDLCVQDTILNWVGNSERTCPGDPTGNNCFYDDRTTLLAGSSTLINKCPNNKP